MGTFGNALAFYRLFYKQLALEPILNELRDSENAQFVFISEALEIRRPAIEPSSLMISQITPAGSNPARRARSTEPSVCPDLTSTPPSRAQMGKTCPGETMLAGLALGETAVLIVVARSAAEIPVVTPLCLYTYIEVGTKV